MHSKKYRSYLLDDGSIVKIDISAHNAGEFLCEKGFPFTYGDRIFIKSFCNRKGVIVGQGNGLGGMIGKINLYVYDIEYKEIYIVKPSKIERDI